MKLLQQFLQGKSPNPALCEDAIYQSADFIAVIDGVTAKGSRLYGGKSAGAFAAEVLCRALDEARADASAAEVIAGLNGALRTATEHAASGADARLPERKPTGHAAAAAEGPAEETERTIASGADARLTEHEPTGHAAAAAEGPAEETERTAAGSGIPAAEAKRPPADENISVKQKAASGADARLPERKATEHAAAGADARLPGRESTEHAASGADARLPVREPANRPPGIEGIPPAERPQANIVLFSRARSEVWLFGDCQFLIGGRRYVYPKEADLLLASLRSFLAQDLIRQGQAAAEASAESRAQILPYLKAQLHFANRTGPYGYDVLDGGSIITGRIRIVPAAAGDRIVLASDGYPLLFDTLEESEQYLAEMLKRDPYCIGENRQTKGMTPGNVSYDDRAYISFCV